MLGGTSGALIPSRFAAETYVTSGRSGSLGADYFVPCPTAGTTMTHLTCGYTTLVTQVVPSTCARPVKQENMEERDGFHRA
jgi:hypothetical protein